ncbi:uncharacterized protein LOC136030597 [Artemia franciscana]|uniref:uncharacterized protein LOC136030597 n=1 Tax=Artemia franciscana TaxID=6661 RepID=UPI0032DBE084
MRANLATAFPALSDGSRLATSSKSELATILSSRHGLNIGCWNLCSIKCSLTQAFVAEEFYLYNLDILCVSETRLNGQTTLDLIAPSGKKAILFNSGPMDGSGLAGVGIIMTPKIASGLLDYEAVSDRIVMACLKGQSNNLTKLSVYAPIRDAPDHLKDKFYADLQLTLNKIPRKDILVIGGDFNARIGTRLNDSEWAIGSQGLGNYRINGVRLIMFAMLNSLSVANAWFKHKPCHTYTRRSRDGRTRAQIDYSLVSRRWKSMIKDSRVYRGADTGSKSGSDHLLLKSKVRSRLSSKKVSAPRCILDTAKLKLPEIKETFMLELTNRFTALQDNDREFKTNQAISETETSAMTEHENFNPLLNIEKRWIKFRNQVKEAATKTLGVRDKKPKRWISQKTIELSLRKKQMTDKHSASFKALCKECHKSAKADKQAYWSNVACEMEKAAARNDSRKLYQLLGESTGKKKQRSTPTLLSKDNKLLTSKEDRIERWRAHFQELLHQPENDHSQPIPSHSSSESPSLYEAISPLQAEKKLFMP